MVYGRMAAGSESYMASAPVKTGYGHREIKAVQWIMHEVVKKPEQGARPCLSFEFTQRFGVNPVGHERRTDAVARHVAHEQAEEFVAMRKSHAEVTAKGVRRAVIGLNGEIVPNHAAWYERFLDARSEREFILNFLLTLLQERIGLAKLLFNPFWALMSVRIRITYSRPSGP
jgi:hypothetical protein